jgi:endonuclease G
MRVLVLLVALVFPMSALACDVTALTGAPITQSPGISICRSGYEVLYRPEYKTAYWSAEHIRAEEVRGNTERSNRFSSDPNIPDHLEAQLDDYYRSGYSRGHLAPAGNFRNSQRESDESFYLTNIVPQVQKCNNSGVWSQIEEIVRDWAVHYGELYVVTGPIYWGDIRTIGSGVRVPDALYKVIWNPKLNETLAFMVPNQPLCKSKPRDWTAYIDDVEALANIDFFPKINSISSNRLWN